MKKITFTALILCLVTVSFAQEKRKEVGFEFSNLNSFGLTYKSGTETSLWRYSLLMLSAAGSEEKNQVNSSENKNYYYGFGFGIGKEFRKTITDNLEFRYGADIGFTYNYNKNIYNNSNNSNYQENMRHTYTPSVIAVIGFNYIFNKNLALGLEILPGFRYTTGKNESNNISSDIAVWSVGFNNNSAKLSLSYRF